MKTSVRYEGYIDKILHFIENKNHVLISAHINADGDAIASIVAVNFFLQKLGKNTSMVIHDQKVDGRLNFLAGYEQIQFYSEKLRNELRDRIDSAIILDVPSYKRLGDVCEMLPEKNSIVKIDHHPYEDRMGDLEWIEEDASSTAAMVYEIIEKSGITINAELATAIYTGIVYDTGRFSFSNTTARDMAICARMIEYGTKPSEITNRLFFENSFAALKTIGKGLYSLENYLDGIVNVIYLSLDDMNQSDHGEIEELANYSVAIRGGEVGLFVREVSPGFHKISFRSKGKVDVNRVARMFDGGGHTRAAGCRISGTKNEIIPLVIKEIENQLVE